MRRHCELLTPLGGAGWVMNFGDWAKLVVPERDRSFNGAVVPVCELGCGLGELIVSGAGGDPVQESARYRQPFSGMC